MEGVSSPGTSQVPVPLSSTLTNDKKFGTLFVTNDPSTPEQVANVGIMYDVSCVKQLSIVQAITVQCR